MGVSLLCYGLHEIIGLGLDHYSWSSDFSLAKNQQHLNGCYCKKTNRSFFLEINYVNVKLPWTRSQDIKQHKSQFTNSNFTITQSAKFFWHCVMVMFESRRCFLQKPSKSHFCFKFRGHGNVGQTWVNINDIVKLADPDNHKQNQTLWLVWRTKRENRSNGLGCKWVQKPKKCNIRTGVVVYISPIGPMGLNQIFGSRVSDVSRHSNLVTIGSGVLGWLRVKICFFP